MGVVRGFEQFRDRGKEQLLNGLADNHIEEWHSVNYVEGATCGGLVGMKNINELE